MFTRQIAEGFLIEKLAGIAQIAAGAGRFNGIAHGPAREHHFAAIGPGGAHGGSDALHMGGKGRDGDTALGVLDNVGNGCGDIAFGWRKPFAQDIGGIANQRIDAFIADFGEALFVHPGAEGGGAVNFPVTGMKHGAMACFDQQRAGLRNGMGDVHKFQIKGADLEFSAERNDVNLHIFIKPVFLQLVVQQGRGKGRAVDGAFELRPQPGTAPM